MSEKLSQEEINRLLASAGKAENPALKKFLENGRKFDGWIVERLVKDLLGDEEKGRGKWWGGDSCLTFRELQSYEIKELEGGGFEVSALCEMEYESSHITYDESHEPILQKNNIKLKLGPDLDLEDFDFK